MNVKNRKCIQKLSLKSLYANRRRNLIAIFAIALTTLLFTSMFTIVLSLNASYETYQFRQVGGYAHGTFKDVSPEQAERIAAHPKVKATGVRKVIGITAVSYTHLDVYKRQAHLPYIRYGSASGRLPQNGHPEHLPVSWEHSALSNLPTDANNPSAPGSTAFHPPGTDGYRDASACLLYTSTDVAEVETSQNINVDSVDCRECGGFDFRGLE